MSFLQIGSWNIEHLSNRQQNRQSAYALADHIEMAALHILVLQEVYVTPAGEEVRLVSNPDVVVPVAAVGERRNSDLDVVCHLLHEHLGRPFAYRIFPNRSAGDTSQLCAVLWDSARVALSATMKIDVPHRDGEDALWDRAPHAAKFTAAVKRWRKEGGGWVERDERSSIVIVPLHMKSNYGGATAARRVRGKEAAHLAARLGDVRREMADESLLLIGDTNILGGWEPAIEAFAAAGLIDLNETDQPTYPPSGGYAGAPFDRAFVPEGRPEFRHTRQYALQSANEALHNRLLSDHYLIKVSVKIYLDDADPRA